MSNFTSDSYCPNCDDIAVLTWIDLGKGKYWVQCHQCGFGWSEKEFEKKLRVQAREKEIVMQKVLEERKKTHGNFEDMAFIAISLKERLRACEGWSSLSFRQKQSLEMIMEKTARILAGDAYFKDHWDDIIGYATLGREAPCHRNAIKEYRESLDQRFQTYQSLNLQKNAFTKV